MGTAHASIAIDAPIQVVWSAMLDLPSYDRWNPFILHVDGPTGRPAQVGDRITLHVRFGNGRQVASRERIRTISPPAPHDGDGELRATLAYEFYGRLHVTGLVRGRRTQIVAQRPGESTMYSTTESFHGLFGFVVPTAGVRGGFRRHAKALKSYAEELAATA